MMMRHYYVCNFIVKSKWTKLNGNKQITVVIIIVIVVALVILIVL
jgi:hypothetical protein